MNTQPTEYDPPAGCHIFAACEKLMAMAPAWMTFNDIRIEATGSETAQQLAERWQALSNARREAYERSPEYARLQAERRERLASRQKMVSALMEYKRFETLESTLDWLDRFTDPADDCDVRFDCDELSGALLRAGYIKSEFVGDQYRERLGRDREAMGRYIVGQVLSCLAAGMPPHPMTRVFIERWRKLAAIERAAT